MKNPGMYIKLFDGRTGIAYNKEQYHPDKIIVKLINEYLKPVISKKTGKQEVVFCKPEDVTLIGYCD